ncbi:MAG: tetratricopeptide repeat protein [Planctomycetes bacterium]|nr:tetratricopeptide repeat protein [Planctomycetota bacterium]
MNMLLLLLCLASIIQDEDPLKRFLNSDDRQLKYIDLGMEFAKSVEPDLNAGRWREEVRTLAGRARKKIAAAKNAAEKIQVINDVLFGDSGLTSVVLDDSLEGKLINRVLHNKRGDCMGLSLLYLCVGEAIGLPLFMVEVPGHVFVRFDDGKSPRNIECTDTGKEAANDFYVKLKKITPNEIQKGIYLRNLAKKEVVGVFLRNRGRHLKSLKRYDDACGSWELATAFYPSYGAAYIDWAELLRERSELDKAIAVYAQGGRKASHDWRVWNNYGQCFEEEKDYRRAIEQYQQAMSLNDGSDVLHQNLAFSHYKLDDRDIAKKYALKCVELNDRNDQGHFLLAVLYYHEQDYDSSERHFLKLLEIKPDHAEARRQIEIVRRKKAENKRGE